MRSTTWALKATFGFRSISLSTRCRPSGVGALNVLEAARLLNQEQPVRVYQASSSEMYGDVLETPQTETTPFNPQSPYACAKVYAYHQTVNYRRSYDLFASNGILFNHESERRGETFVTRKITRAAGRIKAGLQDRLFLGNLDAKRDWGYAKDYVEGMWRILQHAEPDDFVLATGRTQSVRDFCRLVFEQLEMNYEDYVEIDPRYFRPAEVDLLLGDASKAKEKLGWVATTNLEELARIMTTHDDELAQRRGARQEFHPELGGRWYSPGRTLWASLSIEPVSLDIGRFARGSGGPLT